MAIPIDVDKVKAYRAEHPEVDLRGAVRAVRSRHIHTPRMDTFRFTMCKRGHTATYQRYCTECGAKFCIKCQDEKLAKRSK